MALPKEKKYTANEFFAYTYDDDNHYELINGDIVALSAPSKTHQKIVMRGSNLIDNFIIKNNGKCEVLISPFEVVFDEYNVVQPDIFVVCNPYEFKEKRCYCAPDCIIEVTSSNYRRDYLDKPALYSNAGVREYWIVDPDRENTLVYFFEKSARPDIYTFDTPIPVGIYNGELILISNRTLDKSDGYNSISPRQIPL